MTMRRVAGYKRVWPRALPGLHWREVLIDRVGLGGHDVVVAVETVDGVGPPGDGDLAPLGEDGRMVTGGLGRLANALGEGEGGDEVLELEPALEARLAIDLDQCPAGDLASQLLLFLRGHARGVGAARFAGFLSQWHVDRLPSARSQAIA